MDLISGASGEGKGQGQEEWGQKEKKSTEEVEMVTVRKDGVLVKVSAMSRSDRRSKS
jgi:hypothetical protein